MLRFKTVKLPLFHKPLPLFHKPLPLFHKPLFGYVPRVARCGRIEIGDAVLLLYILAFIRQYLWIVDGTAPLVWVLTVLCSLPVWFLHLYTKEPVGERLPSLFWLIVALPLLVMYGMRVAFPDLAFDVLNFRLFQSERALRGTLFTPGDFFPTIFPLNPVPDMVIGIGRHLLGYRAGTIVNYLAMVWTGTILHQLLRLYIASKWLRCYGVLLVLLTEQMLFLINTYMVDLLALPLLLEATLRALSYDESKSQSQTSIRIALLLGASVAFKLTNLAFVIPILLVYLYQVVMVASATTTTKPPIIQRRSAAAVLAVCVVGAFMLLPLLPHTLYIHHHTGNPVFPMYNSMFKSPLWPVEGNYFDPRWGPRGIWETALWPVVISFVPERLCETNVYSGRMSVGFVVAVLCLLFMRTDRRLRCLSVMFLTGSLLWSVTTGYVRYALYLELLAGLLVLGVASYLWVHYYRSPKFLRRVAPVLLWCVLVAQSVLVCSYVHRYDWSERPTAFSNFALYQTELRYLFRDYSLIGFLSRQDVQSLEGVEVWIESGSKTNAFEVLLDHSAPVISVNMYEYFLTKAANAKFTEAVNSASGERMFSLCQSEDLDSALQFITSRGLAPAKIIPLQIPFYSERSLFNVWLIEVLIPSSGEPKR